MLCQDASCVTFSCAYFYSASLWLLHLGLGAVVRLGVLSIFRYPRAIGRNMKSAPLIPEKRKNNLQSTWVFHKDSPLCSRLFLRNILLNRSQPKTVWKWREQIILSDVSAVASSRGLLSPQFLTWTTSTQVLKVLEAAELDVFTKYDTWENWLCRNS